MGRTGLTQNISSTGYRTKKLYEGYQLKSVYQAIKDLSSQFFDFTIKPYLDESGDLLNQFTIGTSTSDPNPPAPKGGWLGRIYDPTNLTQPVFQFPGNLVSYTFPEDAAEAANRLYGLGYGNNNSKVVAKAIDQSKIGTNGTWPLLEATTNFTDIGELQLLKDLTLGKLNATSYPPTTIQIVIPTYVDPVFTQYQIGDQVRLDIKDDYFPTGISFGADDDALRIVAITVEPGENGPSRVTITLTRQAAAGTVE